MDLSLSCIIYNYDIFAKHCISGSNRHFLFIIKLLKKIKSKSAKIISLNEQDVGMQKWQVS